MAITYDTLGATISIEPNGVVAPGGLNTAVAIVGGYDATNGAATAGEATPVTSSTEADDQFGATSELARQAALAFANGATTVYGVPVPETEATESFTGGDSTSAAPLSNVPAFDPRVQPEHTITVTDTSANSDLTVEYVYGSPSSPATADTIEINPLTGEWAADASSDYQITYTYGEYGDAITTAVGQPVRAVVVCTEADTLITTLQTELSTAASNFRFLRGFVGAEPNVQTGSVTGYTPVTDDLRVVEVAPARGTGADGGVRAVGAVAGLMASQPIDVTGSITYDRVSGLTDLNVSYPPTTAESFERVTALTDEFEVAEGITTSSEGSFADIYKVEIIDTVIEQLYARIKNYRGGSNAQSAQRRFKSRLTRVLSSLAAPTAQPPLLADGGGGQPYAVTVSQGATDTETEVSVGIDPAPIAKEVTLSVGVGPIQFNGVSVEG